MKTLLRISCTTTGLLLFLGIFWLPRDAAQGGITYTDTVTLTVATHNLKHPTGLAVQTNSYGTRVGASFDPCTGNFPYGLPALWIDDTGNNLIRVFNGTTLCTIAGNGTAGFQNGKALTNSEFNSPTGVDLEQLFFSTGKEFLTSEHVYINDANNFVVRMFCVGPAAADGFDGTCPGNPAVETYAGKAVKGYVNGPASQAEFAHPGAMHASLGYTVDTENHAIRVLGPTISTFAGNGSPGFVNGPIASAQFNFPTKLAKDANGNIYVADTGNSVIRKIDTSNNVTTFAGSGVPGYADGTGGSAQFRIPSGIVYNSNTNTLYVADSGNNLIRQITMAGTVTTYAGNGTGGFVNGALLQSEFYHPTDVAVMGSNLVVSDTYNNAIRLINTSTSTVSTLID